MTHVLNDKRYWRAPSGRTDAKVAETTQTEPALGRLADVSTEAAAAEAIRGTLTGLELEWSEPRPGLFSVTLPGTRKLTTACALEVGTHGVGIRAFVARNPDENHVAVYRWLLERNLKLYGVAFSVDSLGDIYLTGKVALDRVTPDEVDRVLGTVAEAADSSFNTILELGFAASIRREFRWRRSRGESLTNLAAFSHLDPESPHDSGGADDPHALG
jgi:hypothetical protein